MPPLYATRAEVVEAAGGTERLLQIADLDGNGTEDTGLVDRTLVAVEGVVNSYLRMRYAVPLSPVPDVIVQLVAKMCVYELTARRGMLVEQEAENQAERMKWLGDLSTGRVDLGVSAPPSPHNRPSASARSDAKAVSRDAFKGFS